MKQLSGEAQELIAQTRQLDEPTMADRLRLRERLDTSWAATSAAPQVGATLLKGKLLLSATSFVAVASTGLWLATATPTPKPAAPIASTQLAAASPADISAPPSPEPEPEPEPQPASTDQTASSSALPHGSASARPTSSASANGASRAGRKRAAAKAVPQAPVEIRSSELQASAPPVSGAPTESSSSELQANVANQVRAEKPATHPADPQPEAIGDEVMLLGAAQKELRAGQPTRALGYIQQHAFRFPTGALAQERAAVQALALCALNRKTAARQVFEDLARRAPAAAVLPRIRRDCGF